MSNIRRITVLLFAAAALSLGTVGCKSGDKAGSADHSKNENSQKKTEPPKGDHPKH